MPRHVSMLIGELLCVLNAFGFPHLDVLGATVHRELAVGHRVKAMTAGTEIHVMKLHREAGRRRPRGNVLRLRPHVIDRLNRRVKAARDHEDVLVCRFFFQVLRKTIPRGVATGGLDKHARLLRFFG